MHFIQGKKPTKIFYNRLFKFYTFGNLSFGDRGPFQQEVFQVVPVSEPQILPTANTGTAITVTC